jgi:hypothetical protein
MGHAEGAEQQQAPILPQGFRLMATGIYSKGYKKKPGSTPTREAAPSRQSGGTSGDLSIPGYTPKTPTVPYSPSAPPTSIQQGIRHETSPPPSETSAGSTSLADRYLFHRLADLLTPGPTAAEIAQAASTLGVKPKALSAGVSAASKGVSEGIKELGKDVAEGVRAATKLPDHRVVRAFGHKTLGTPTLRQLTSAERKGQLQVNQKGRVTVPATRKAARELTQARRSASGVGQIEGVTHGPQAERFANALAKLTGISPKAIGAWVQAEGGGWGGSGVSGGEAGKNNWLGVGYPGEQTPFSQSPYFNRSPELAAKATAAWMEGKIGHEYNYRAAPSIQSIIPQSKGKGPQAFLRALGSSGWGTDVGSVAQDLGMIHISPADPKVLRQLAAARVQAQKLGIPTRAVAGDLERGGGKVIYVRADGQGMVKWAESVVGTQEGSAKAERWGAKFGLNTVSQPWCANFVSNGLLRRGITNLPSNPNYVPSYEAEWSQYAVPGGLAKAKPGDLVTFSGQHIGIYIGGGEMISGNSSDAVSRTAVGEPSMVIRPPYRGGKVAVPESTPLPGSAIGSEGLASLPAGAAVAGAEAAAGGSGAPRPPAPAVPLSAVPVSSLLDVHTPLPRAFGQFELGEGSQEESPVAEGVIARILRGRRR